MTKAVRLVVCFQQFNPNDNKTQMRFKIRQQTPLATVKTLCCQSLGLEPQLVHLLLDGSVIDTNQCPNQMGIVPGNEAQLILRKECQKTP